MNHAQLIAILRTQKAPRRFKRVVVWFSAGATSAVAGHFALEKWRGRLPVVFAYCDTGAEHPDNLRFISDCERWYGRKIQTLKNPVYQDIWDVFERTRYLTGPTGARCTTEMKKNLRTAFQDVATDLQVFGFDASEQNRHRRFVANNPEISLEVPLIERGLTKLDCFKILERECIDLPAMYRLGYRNNNCIGCVKGGQGYWNKIRRDFPDVFSRMAKLEQSIGAAVCRTGHKSEDGKRFTVPIFLKDLAPDAGQYDSELSLSCGFSCGVQE